MSNVAHLDLRPAEPKALPNNIEAEQALLGCLLYDNDAMHRVEAVEAVHFYEPCHQRLFAEISRRIGAGQLAEPINVAAALKDDPALIELGGLRYLADLVDKAPPAINAGSYATEVIDLYTRRELARIGREAEARANDREDTAAHHLDAIEGALFSLGEDKRGEGGFVDFGDAVDGALEAASRAFQKDGAITGISTGLIDLDQKLGGLHPSDLIVLAGRPSMGKTALGTNIAYHAAKEGKSVGFYSLEMSKEQLTTRILADVTGISSDRIRKGEIDANEYRRLHEAGQELRRLPLHIDETGGLSIAKLCARARRLKRRKGLDLIIVDYLQLATATEKGRGNRVQEVSEITQALKALAKELGVPVVALSQLSRQVENREDKRPMLSDLRESGSIEQDADVVMFVYREEYYLSRAEPRDGTAEHLQWQEDMDRVNNLAEVIIGKQRHGPIGTVKLHFNADLTKFGNLAREGSYAETRTRIPYGAD